MRTPGERRCVWLRAWGYLGIGLAVGGTSLAQDAGRGAWPVLPAPGAGGLPPFAQPQLKRLRLTAGVTRSYDACLVKAPTVDPRFVVQARPMDEPMVAPSRVAGLYRGTLVPRR